MIERKYIKNWLSCWFGREQFRDILYLKDIKYFFNLDNLEPASGRPDPELEVKALKIGKLDVLEQAPGCQIEKWFYILQIYTDMRFPTKN